MPTYQYRCTKCEQACEYVMKISELDSFESKCEACDGELRQAFISPPNVTIPAKSTHDGKISVSGSRTRNEKAIIPLNIFDEKPDGSYKVTRIGSKADIDND